MSNYDKDNLAPADLAKILTLPLNEAALFEHWDKLAYAAYISDDLFTWDKIECAKASLRTKIREVHG